MKRVEAQVANNNKSKNLGDQDKKKLRIMTYPT